VSPITLASPGLTQPAKLPDTDTHGKLPIDLHGYCIGQAPRAESIEVQYQRGDASFFMIRFLEDCGLAVSVKIRQFSVLIRVKRLIFRR
jgi:hypothetical protein